MVVGEEMVSGRSGIGSEKRTMRLRGGELDMIVEGGLC